LTQPARSWDDAIATAITVSRDIKRPVPEISRRFHLAQNTTIRKRNCRFLQIDQHHVISVLKE
jgi:hypothetical protein